MELTISIYKTKIVVLTWFSSWFLLTKKISADVVLDEISVTNEGTLLKVV